ncbi:MAG: sodium:proline symporter, partial [Oscillospiraceae bacterium]|nr:sodium:proline symporter [Oscillospiraceae bacterium]
LLDNDGQQLMIDGLPQFGDANTYGIITIVSGLAWGLGYFGMPQVLIRFMSIRHSDEIKKSRIIAMIWLVISMTSAVCIGLIGRAYLPDYFATQSAAESVFIVLAQILLPSFFCGLVVSGIFAAAMSSSSSYLLISGSAVATNIFKGLIKRDATDRQVMIVARVTLTCILVLGCFLAMDQNSSIFNIVSYAWAGFGASFGPLMLCSLYWRRTTLPGAIAGMLTGAATVIIWNNFIAPLGGWFGGNTS